MYHLKTFEQIGKFTKFLQLSWLSLVFGRRFEFQGTNKLRKCKTLNGQMNMNCKQIFKNNTINMWINLIV